jgi:CheY-like chemotaxis protein
VEPTIMSHPRWCPACRAVQSVQERPGGGPAQLQCATCATPFDAVDAAGTAAAPPRATVLCIDDDPLVLHFYRAFLEHRGYRTLTADDGPVGLEIAQRERPDVILLDVMLRGLSGFDICRKLRAEPALWHAPIILLTVWDHPSLMATGREAGATLTLRKPADAETIVAAIEQVLGQPDAPAAREGRPPDTPPAPGPEEP